MVCLSGEQVRKRDCYRDYGRKTVFKSDEKGLHFVRTGCKACNCRRRGPTKLRKWVKSSQAECRTWDVIVYLSLTMKHDGLLGLPFHEQDKVCMPTWIA